MPIEVVDGLAVQLPADDGGADAVVTSLVLCSVADTSGLARAQRLMDATIWPRLAGGCHTGRDTHVVPRAGHRGARVTHLRSAR